MQTREKIMVGGLLLIVGAYFLPTMVLMPQWKSLGEKNTLIEADEAKIPTLDATNARLGVEISRLKKLETVPTGVNIRKIEDGNPQASVKAMLDDLITLANHVGNDLISLVPFTAVSELAAPPASSATPSSPASPPSSSAAPPNETPPPEPVSPPATTPFGYALTIRGTYSAIERYIAVLSTHTELVEIQSVTFQNEGGQHREQLSSGELPTTKPMRAELKLVLYLQ